MQQRAIITRADNNVLDWINCTHDIMKDYADKCNADFIVLNHKVIMKNHHPIFWRILKSKELLKKYDQILHLDTDILVLKGCPNIFEQIPLDTIGVVFEDKGTRVKDRRNRIVKIQNKYGDIGWKTGYLNEGVLLFSKNHSVLFDTINDEYWDDRVGPSQTHFGYQINKYKLKVKDLGYKWNHMSMFSEPWNKSANRFNSYMIHYAGGAKFLDRGNRSALELAISDKKKIYG